MADRAEVHPLLAPSVPPLPPLVLPPCDAYRLGHRGALTQETGERGGKDISETESRSTNVWGSSPCQFPQNLDFYWPKTTKISSPFIKCSLRYDAFYLWSLLKYCLCIIWAAKVLWKIEMHWPEVQFPLAQQLHQKMAGGNHKYVTPCFVKCKHHIQLSLVAYIWRIMMRIFLLYTFRL